MLAQKIQQILQQTEIAFTAVTKEELDLTDSSKVLNFIDSSFTHVINAAAMTNVDLCETEKEKCKLNNVTAVENLTNACKTHDIHLVHVSTDFVFDGSKHMFNETDETNPLSYYGECKLEAEKIVSKYDKSAILRTQMVYGLSKKQNIFLWIKKSLEEGKEISLFVDQWRTPTFVDDLATACIKACELSSTGIYHISGKDTLTPYWLGIEVAKFFNLNQSLIKKTDTELTTQKAVRPLRSCFNIEKAKRDLQYQPHSIIESFRVMQLAEQSA